MKRILSTALAAALLIGCLSGCGAAGSSGTAASGGAGSLGFGSQADPVQLYDLNALAAAAAIPTPEFSHAISIALSDDGITVDGAAVGSDETAAVYTANDIVYYEAGRDFTYGEGTQADAHSAEEAAAHTVVHITQPGVYRLSGSLSAGQIAVDLGENAEDDPNAVVTLVLDQLDLTCTVAPAILFYRVYECGSKEADTASRQVDTTAAGANVVIADGSVNNIRGSYVARIYKSVELNEAGTEVVDSKKLHKYDAAFYSKMSMNLFGEAENTGVLNITAENEGLDSELHLTLNGGQIHITSGNDGINTNEDGVSVTTINGGLLEITVTGQTGEGDGIDSNGWLVINGGVVHTSACADSADAGIDSDLGIWLNGGVVSAGGHMLDQIAGGDATYAVFQFAQSQPGGETYTLNNADGTTVAAATPANNFSVLVLAAPALSEGEYTLWRGEVPLAGRAGMTMSGGQRPGGFGEMPQNGEMPVGGPKPDDAQDGSQTPPARPDGGQLPAEGEMPQRPDEMQRPAEGEAPQPPQEGQNENNRPTGDRAPGGFGGEISTTFSLTDGGNRFAEVTEAAE